MLCSSQMLGSHAPKQNRAWGNLHSLNSHLINKARCCFTTDTISMKNQPMCGVLLSSFHRWRNQNSDELSHLSKSPKPDVECKARSSDTSQGSLHSTSDFKRCTSWPHIYLLLPISMTLFLAQGWKSRPACTGDGATDYTLGDPFPRSLRGDTLLQLACFRYPKR